MQMKNNFFGFLMLLIPVLIIFTGVWVLTGKLREEEAEAVEPKEEIEAPPTQETTEQEETPPALATPELQDPVIEEEEEEGLSEEEKEKTKELTKKFAEAYYNYDAEDQEGYLKNSKPFMTEKFYNHEYENLRRNPLEKSVTEVLEIELYPVDVIVENEIAWNALIVGEATSSDGEKTLHEESLWVVLEKVESEWKVKGATFDAW